MHNNQSMTSGSPQRLLVRFSLPLFYGSLISQGYFLINSIIVGKAVGISGLAAMGAATYLDWFWIGFAMMLVQGFGIHIAQRYGAGDAEDLRKALAMAFEAALGSALFLTVVGLLLIPAALRLLNTPQEVFQSARLYISIVIAGTALPVVTHMAYAALRAMGDSRTPARCLALKVFVNIALDVVLVSLLRMDIYGAAIGWMVANLATWPVLFKAFTQGHSIRLTRADFKPNLATLRTLFALGVPIALQNSIALFGIVMLQIAVNGFGALSIAAYSTAVRLLELMKVPGDVLSQAITAFTGQNAGAKNLRRVRQGFREGLKLLLIVCCATTLFTLLLGGSVLSLIIPAAEAETATRARALLQTFAIMLPALYLMDGFRAVLQGMGKPFMPMLSGAVELILRSALSLTLPAAIGFAAIGITDTSAWLGAAILLVIGYYFIMKKKRVEEEIMPSTKT